MHIVLVAPMVSPIRTGRAPLGGAQALVGDLGEGLVHRGHRVTLLAANGSSIRGAEIPELGIDSSALVRADFSAEVVRMDTEEQTRAFASVRAWVQRHVNDIDVVHAHAYDAPAFEQLDGLATPVIHTLHLPPLDADVVRAARSVARRATLAAVSATSRREWVAARVPVSAVLTAGLELSSIPFSLHPGAYLLFAGRMTPEKGPDRAIDIASNVGLPLMLVGDVYDEAFYDAQIRPRVRIRPNWALGDLIDDGATYIGPRPREQLWSIMASAMGVLMPIRWAEPFGLVALEAQATGTPVVAYRRGGLLEVVGHGRGGWLVEPDDNEAFCQAVEMLAQLDRAECRAWVAEHFSMEAMLAAHELLYDRVRNGAS